MTCRGSSIVLMLTLLGACSEAPTEPVSTLSFNAVAAGYYHSCGITTDGRVHCWGSGEDGQVGTFDLDFCEYGAHGAETCALRPRELELTDVTMLTAGGGHTCALDRENRAYCWGAHDFGQLGSGPLPDSCPGFVDLCSSEPRRVLAQPYVRISAGGSHTCGITTLGEAQCWGYGSHGRLGTGTTEHQAVPTNVIGGHAFREIAAGSSSTCGLTTDGRALCWGYNHLGQLGDGTTTMRLEPTPVLTELRFEAITVGTASACALTPDGAAWCWGANGSGELGTGSPAALCGSYGCDPTPRPVLGGHVYQSISAGGAICGTTAEAVLCWGSNKWGETGTGLAADTVAVPTPTSGPALGGVSVSFDHACALDSGGAAYCWGTNWGGALGIGISGGISPTPVAVIGPEDDSV